MSLFRRRPTEITVITRDDLDRVRGDVNQMRFDLTQLRGEWRALSERVLAVSRGLERIESNERLLKELELRVEHTVELCDKDRAEMKFFRDAVKLEHSAIRLEWATVKDEIAKTRVSS